MYSLQLCVFVNPSKEGMSLIVPLLCHKSMRHCVDAFVSTCVTLRFLKMTECLFFNGQRVFKAISVVLQHPLSHVTPPMLIIILPTPMTPSPPSDDPI